MPNDMGLLPELKSRLRVSFQDRETIIHPPRDITPFQSKVKRWYTFGTRRKHQFKVNSTSGALLMLPRGSYHHYLGGGKDKLHACMQDKLSEWFAPRVDEGQQDGKSLCVVTDVVKCSAWATAIWNLGVPSRDASVALELTEANRRYNWRTIALNSSVSCHPTNISSSQDFWHQFLHSLARFFPFVELPCNQDVFVGGYWVTGRDTISPTPPQPLSTDAALRSHHNNHRSNLSVDEGSPPNGVHRPGSQSENLMGVNGPTNQHTQGDMGETRLITVTRSHLALSLGPVHNPCEVINKFVLALLGTLKLEFGESNAPPNYAISHDNDWAEIVELNTNKETMLLDQFSLIRQVSSKVKFVVDKDVVCTRDLLDDEKELITCDTNDSGLRDSIPIYLEFRHNHGWLATLPHPQPSHGPSHTAAETVEDMESPMRGEEHVKTGNDAVELESTLRHYMADTNNDLMSNTTTQSTSTLPSSSWHGLVASRGHWEQPKNIQHANSTAAPTHIDHGMQQSPVDPLEQATQNHSREIILETQTQERGYRLRPEPWIWEVSDSPQYHHSTKQVVLDSSISTRKDIKHYLLHGFQQIRESLEFAGIEFPDPWPASHILEILIRKAGGQLIYAVTLIRLIGGSHTHPPEQLKIVLNAPQPEPLQELDVLYRIVLSANPNHEELFTLLAAILVLPHLASPAFLDMLFELAPGTASLTLGSMHPVLDIQGQDDPIRIHHTSFSDFLEKESCSGSFFVHRPTQHTLLLQRWGRVIMKGWRDDKDQSQNRPDGKFPWTAWADYCLESPNKKVLHDLDNFYTTILSKCSQHNEVVSILAAVVGSLTSTPKEIEVSLGYTSTQLTLTLQEMDWVLLSSGCKEKIAVAHPSFVGFLLDQSRSQQFSVDRNTFPPISTLPRTSFPTESNLMPADNTQRKTSNGHPAKDSSINLSKPQRVAQFLGLSDAY
ncbi:hypothetical protein V5O48_010878 [Marasmius crinis-equi]|uniref:Uncharacterized protein n=1 Tax=Marasmius crinis-equi TaxID=585013 RepID=A0ABR3F7P2_9AGAR